MVGITRMVKKWPSQCFLMPSTSKRDQVVLTECGLWPKKGLHLECKPKCASGSWPADCCARNLLQSQPDFQEQKSRVQEIIEEAGHLCIFLLEYHCELNFIEYFWAAVKRYL